MSKKPLRVFPDEQVTVLDLGDMEIWDGADMALLRESLTRLIKFEKRRSIGIDMSHVKYIPSGFFGMLFDWYETGVQIRLYSPQPNVRKMLWFNRFFKAVSEVCHELKPRPDSDFPRGYPLTAEPVKVTNATPPVKPPTLVSSPRSATTVTGCGTRLPPCFTKSGSRTVREAKTADDTLSSTELATLPPMTGASL